MKKTRYKMEVYHPEVIEIIEAELDDEELSQYREIVDQARKEFLEEYPEDANNEEGWRQWLTDTIINEGLTILLWDGFVNMDAQVRWIDLDHPIVEEEETEFDKILDMPENHQVMEDGSILYGYTEEPKFLSREYFRDIKNGLQMVWQAKNPFNDHRSVLKAGLPLVHPDMYRIFFPFSYLAGLIAPIFTRDKDARRNALYNFFGSSFGEILLLSLFGLIVCGVAILWIA